MQYRHMYVLNTCMELKYLPNLAVSDNVGMHLPGNLCCAWKLTNEMCRVISWDGPADS